MANHCVGVRCDVTEVELWTTHTPPVDTEDGWEGSSWSLQLAPPQPDSRDQEQGHLVSADTSQAKVGILAGLKQSVSLNCHRPVCGSEISYKHLDDLEMLKVKTPCVCRLDCDCVYLM